MVVLVCYIHSNLFYCLLHTLCVALEDPQASVYFLPLCCSFLFRDSPLSLLNINTSAPIPLVMGIRTSPSPATLSVIHVEETPNTKTPSID